MGKNQRKKGKQNTEKDEIKRREQQILKRHNRGCHKWVRTAPLLEEKTGKKKK